MTLEFIKIKEEHLEIIRKWRTDPDVSRFMYTDPSISPGEQKRWYEKIQKDASKRYWIIKSDDEYVGLVNFYDIDERNKRCSWAYYLGEAKHRGKGFGREIELNILSHAFDERGYNKLCCEVFAENEIVVKIHQKYGSKIEGVLRKHICKNCKFHDVVVMGILKDEWDELKKGLHYPKIKIE